MQVRHRSSYKIKKGKSKTQYRRVCRDLKKTVKKARNEFEKSDLCDLTTNKEKIAKIRDDHFQSIFIKESDSNPPRFVKRTGI